MNLEPVNNHCGWGVDSGNTGPGRAVREEGEKSGVPRSWGVGPSVALSQREWSQSNQSAVSTREAQRQAARAGEGLTGQGKGLPRRGCQQG